MIMAEDIIHESKFNCPKPVIALCLVFGIVLGLHYSLLVAKPLYITEDLKMTRTMGIFLSHFPVGVRLMGGIIGAILADSYFGKFNVIATSYALVCLIPGPLVVISTFHSFSLETRKILYIISLTTDLIVGFGSVVHPVFIAEQFKMPQQESSLQAYYMFDYFYYNVCVAALEFVTLEFTNEVSCFGAPKCYQILFITYFISFAFATVLFIFLKKWYTIRMPERSVMKDSICCIWTALKNRRKMRGCVEAQQYNHWLDWADCFDQEWRNDLKRIIKMLTMLLPYFVYYFLYAQMNSMWIYQACRLDSRLTESWTMKPSQVESLNPLVIIVVAPIVEFLLNPFLEKVKFLNTPLQRIGVAYFLTIIAFIMAASLQIFIDRYGSPLFTNGKAQFRMFNCLAEEIDLTSDWTSGDVMPYSVAQALEIDADGMVHTKMDIKLPGGIWSGLVTAEEGKGINYIISNNGVKKLNQELDSTLMTSLRPSLLIICSHQCKGKFLIEYGKHYTTEIYELEKLKDTAFTITLQSAGPAKFYIDSALLEEYSIGDGGLYGVVIFRMPGNPEQTGIKINTLLKPNSISILWIFPQYITITIAEIFIYVSINIFVYTQSPPNMRGIVRGLFTAGNSLAQITLGAAALIHVPEVIWFFSLAVILVFATIVHIIMAKSYIYQEAHD